MRASTFLATLAILLLAACTVRPLGDQPASKLVLAAPAQLDSLKGGQSVCYVQGNFTNCPANPYPTGTCASNNCVYNAFFNEWRCTAGPFDAGGGPGSYMSSCNTGAVGYFNCGSGAVYCNYVQECEAIGAMQCQFLGGVWKCKDNGNPYGIDSVTRRYLSSSGCSTPP
jgi:hypothetical protein